MEDKRVHKEIQKLMGVYLEMEWGGVAVGWRGLCFLACLGCKQAGVPGVLCSSSSTDC